MVVPDARKKRRKCVPATRKKIMKDVLSGRVKREKGTNIEEEKGVDNLDWISNLDARE